MSPRRPPRSSVCKIVALICLASACKKEPTPVARLETAGGAVERQRGGQWAAAAVGTPFAVGDAVRTGAGATARVRFLGGKILRLGENAMVRFVAGSAPQTPAVGIDLGEADVEGDGVFEVATPRGLARLESGSRMTVRATGASVKYEILVGAATLVGDDKVKWGAGEGIEIAVGGARLERYKVLVGATVIEPRAAPTATTPATAGIAEKSQPGAEPGPADEPGAGDGTVEPTVADVTLPAGESAMIHDRHATVAVRIAFETHCPGGGVLELGGTERGDRAFRRPRQRIAGKTAGVLMLPPGSHRYRVACGAGHGRPVAAGILVFRRDSGTAPVPRTAPSNVIDADGRRYTVLYQNRLPALTLVWPNPPKSSELVLHVESNGKEREFRTTSTRHILPSGTVAEGEHRLWFVAADGKVESLKTALTVRFDNAAAAAQLQAPEDGGRWSGPEVEVIGIALEGSTVTVAGKPLATDSHGRFRGQAAPPGASDRAIAVRLEHPRSGVHYYVRRMAAR